MRKYKYTFYDIKGDILITNTCISETMFQYHYEQWYKSPEFHKAEVELVFED